MATDKQWRDVKALADDIATYSCILELLHRIEALEAATKAQPNHPEIPDSSLKDQIKSLMQNRSGRCTWDEFTASILTEVAAWLSEHAGGTRAAWMLEREAER